MDFLDWLGHAVGWFILCGLSWEIVIPVMSKEDRWMLDRDARRSSHMLLFRKKLAVVPVIMVCRIRR